MIPLNQPPVSVPLPDRLHRLHDIMDLALAENLVAAFTALANAKLRTFNVGIYDTYTTIRPPRPNPLGTHNPVRRVGPYVEALLAVARYLSQLRYRRNTHNPLPESDAHR